MKNNKKAFTLIELLVVIAIIGILATISVIALSMARAKARDAKRVADTKQVSTALETFFNDQGRYPSEAEFSSGTLASSTAIYLQNIPRSPAPNDGACTSDQNTFYYQQTENGASYTLSLCLGNNIGTLSAGPKCLTPGGIINIDCNPNCVDANWGPSPGAVCNNEDYNQISNCGNTQPSIGTLTCAGGQTCANGICNCQPHCSGHNCGDDGCNGSCGTCTGNDTCSNGTCTPPPFVCGESLLYGGVSYPTMLVGSKCWFAKNLNVGAMVPNSQDQVNFSSAIQKYCYNNQEANCTTDGGLYQWHMAAGKNQSCDDFDCVSHPSDACCVITGNDICPSGWHVPSSSDWATLLAIPGFDTGHRLKKRANLVDPNNPNGLGCSGSDADDADCGSSGFGVLLAGSNQGHASGYRGIYGLLWTSTPTPSSLYSYLAYWSAGSPISSQSHGYRVDGFSVRCVQD